MNKININLTKEEIIIELSKNSTLEEILLQLKDELTLLENFNFEEKKIPITITGIILSEEDFKKIATQIKEKANTIITYKKPNSMGLHNIQKTYEIDANNTLTRFVRTSLRSGQKLEYDGSLVIMGDVNPGSEVIASGNIIVVGTLRGIAHAGAKGNRKAFISAYSIDTPQLRIANIVTGFIKSESQPQFKYASVKEGRIILEE